MVTGLFDLNIEQVLESWTIADALRELIANALDEQTLTNTKSIEIYKKDNIWHIRDFGRGLEYKHFTQNENDEKNLSSNLIGRFGVGLKDALGVLYRRGCHIHIESKHNCITTKMAKKSGFNLTTLHAEFSAPANSTMIGTDFAITGISDADMEEAKSRFLIFNNLTKLETTKYGEVYDCEDSPAIYINGVKVADEPNFMFSYNITNINAQIRKALNRERSNVGRTAYADTIKNILKTCKADIILSRLIKDLQNYMYGTNKDETAWVDVAVHAALTLNKNDEGNIIFITPPQQQSLTNQQLEIIKESGKNIILVTNNVFDKIKQHVETIETVQQAYINSFQYKFISDSELTSKEKQTFGLRSQILSCLSEFRHPATIKISETICPTVYGDTTEGVWDSVENAIIIKRSVLQDEKEFCAVLAHELSHYQHDYEDNTRDFENDLTTMLGHVLWQLIKSNSTCL